MLQEQAEGEGGKAKGAQGYIGYGVHVVQGVRVMGHRGYRGYGVQVVQGIRGVAEAFCGNFLQ